MRRTRQKKTNKQSHKKRKSTKPRRTFKRSVVPPRRVELMNGGDNGSVSFPASISNNSIAVSPQSYLPFNNFANDPGYSVIDSRNTGPFLTGISSGGRRKGHYKQSRKIRAIRGGSGDLHSGMSTGLNTLTSTIGIIPAPAFNELSGVSGIMSGFSGTGSSYNSTPNTIVPLA